MMPLLTQTLKDDSFREGTIHHSVNGSFAIRKGDYKLIMCGGSGGWSFPKPNNKEALEQLPEIQLYNLKNDPGELVNLQAEHPNVVTELKALLTKQILDGRSTKGAKQKNDSGEHWEQLWWVDTN